MKSFKATDYNEYNKRFGMFKYGYLHRLLDLLYKLREQYKIYDERLIYWESETGNQAELKGTMFLDINKRIELHKQIFRELWKLKNKNIVRQLRLFYGGF